MNAQELVRLLQSKDRRSYIPWDTEYSDQLSGTYYTATGDEVQVKVVDSNFHEEGNWHTDLYVVLSVGDQFFKKSGYYQSHDGTYWDGAVVEVEPEEVSVTKWNDSATPYFQGDYDSFDYDDSFGA